MITYGICLSLADLFHCHCKFKKINYFFWLSSIPLYVCTFIYVPVLVSQLCPPLCDPVDCGLPGFSVHGILQSRVLEWAAVSFSRESSQPRD